jgi:hypothetical protein
LYSFLLLLISPISSNTSFTGSFGDNPHNKKIGS